MNSQVSTRLSRRPSVRTKIIWLAAVFLLVVPNYRTGVARASAGDLVAEFGLGGKVTTDFSSNIDVPAAVAIYPDGRIVLAGSARSENNYLDTDIALARYNPDGSLDQTFGNGGLVTTDLKEFEKANAVAIQPDGRIVVAGYISRSDWSNDFLVIRYNEDGTLDSSFGQDGVVTTDFFNTDDFAADMALTRNGEIVVGGTISWNIPKSDFGIARYKSNGDLDETFAFGGKVAVGLDNLDESLAAMVLNPKGEIVLAGQANTASEGSPNFDFVLTRLNRDGSPDGSFGIGGSVTTDFTVVDSLRDVTLTPNGEIIVVGTVEPSPWKFDFVVARYDRHGNLDPSFGTAGRVITDFSMNDFAFSVAVQPNGKIVVAGRSGVVVGSTQNDFALARYERDGNLDQSFGSGGLVTTDFSRNTDEATAVTILPSGRIIVAGLTWDVTTEPFSPSRDFALAEYEAR